MRKTTMRSANSPLRLVVAGALGLTALGVSGMIVVANFDPSSQAESKNAYQQRVAQERQAALSAPRASKNQQHIVVPAAQKLQREAGILDIHDGPVPVSQFLVSNLWQGEVAGKGSDWYVVWAGITRGQDGTEMTPAVIVHTQDFSVDATSLDDRDVGLFPDAAADGPLTITAMNGRVITLKTPSGKTVHFDMATLNFD